MLMKEANLLRVLICSFLSPDLLDGGIDVQVQRAEDALVDGDLWDASRGPYG